MKRRGTRGLALLMGGFAGMVLAGATLLAAGVTGLSIVVAIGLGAAGFAIGWLATLATWGDGSHAKDGRST